MKPDNVLVNWDCNAEGEYRVSNAALGDFDLAFKSENGASYSSPYAIGNVMWRSPEGQTGREMTKASDIFSFGLVVRETHAMMKTLLISTTSAYTQWEEANFFC